MTHDGDEWPSRDLEADCGRCAGLCCVAPAFARSADFAIDKPAGTPCPNLLPDLRCGIHNRLRDNGFGGCAVFDCLGAGQRVTAGRGRCSGPEPAGWTFARFGLVRQLHELLWYLAEALRMPAAVPVHPALAEVAVRVDRAAGAVSAGAAEPADGAEPDALREEVNPLLRKASDLVRATAGPVPPTRRGADLAGARLAGADLRAVELRGALLLGADLRGADLRLADLTGADLRGADLAGADLTCALFVRQDQLEAARGDAATRLPAGRHRPTHWPRF